MWHVALAGLWLVGVGVLFALPHNASLEEPNDYPWCTWSGALEEGRPHGWGTGSCVAGREPLQKRHLMKPPRLVPLQQARYCGTNPLECRCESEVRIASEGMIDNYQTFRGHYVHGRREGEGTFFHADGTIYIGRWQADVPHGSGTLFSESCRIVYAGQWCAGAPCNGVPGVASARSS